MAIGIYFAPTTMTREQYFECIKRLKKAGAGHPPGRVYHACFGTGDRIQVFDVWTSQAAFEKFGKTLMPILRDIGTDSGEPVVMNMHNVITRPRAAVAKRAPAKRASKKTAKKR